MTEQDKLGEAIDKVKGSLNLINNYDNAKFFGELLGYNRLNDVLIAAKAYHQIKPLLDEMVDPMVTVGGYNRAFDKLKEIMKGGEIKAEYMTATEVLNRQNEVYGRSPLMEALPKELFEGEVNVTPDKIITGKLDDGTIVYPNGYGPRGKIDD